MMESILAVLLGDCWPRRCWAGLAVPTRGGSYRWRSS